MEKILFIDRDGTLIEEPTDCQVDALDKIKLCPGVIPSLHALVKAGFTLVMVSNQDGLGTSQFPREAFQQCHDFILELFASQGISFLKIFICPHHSHENCLCRKPKTGLLIHFLQETRVDKTCSWVIGDRDSDRQLADHLSLPFLPIHATHGWPDITHTILNQDRRSHVVRKTKETSVELTVTLDKDAENHIDTPIGFYNHMLDQIAKHGGFQLEVTATGDVRVDDHHLIEDGAMALGEALKKALGDKRGIARYGFTLPMDESLATVALDLSGRSVCVFEGAFTRESVGGMATEMVPHFFHSFANALGATLHVQVTGKNHHHMIEACFKALGRALRQALARCDGDVPSTKGSL